MTRRQHFEQHFEAFTQRHGDTVFTTRFRFVARFVTRFVKTLDWAPEGTEARPGGSWVWWPTARGEAVSLSVTSCNFCGSPAMLLTERFEPVCAGHYGEAVTR